MEGGLRAAFCFFHSLAEVKLLFWLIWKKSGLRHSGANQLRQDE
jgi:hypothetical protein